MAKTIHTDKAPAAIGPYVQGKIVGNLLFASGQVPLSPETGEIIGETIQEQTEQVLKNVGAILAEAGTDFDHVVKTTCFLSDINDLFHLTKFMQLHLKLTFLLVQQLKWHACQKTLKLKSKLLLRLINEESLGSFLFGSTVINYS